MPVTLPNSYQNAPQRLGDVTQTMLDLYSVVQQLNGATGTGIGYVTGQGVGGSVTQITSRATAVTLDKLSGTIIGDSTSLAANASAIFTVNNATVSLTDTVSINLRSGSTASTSIFTVNAVANGSFQIRIANISTTTADTGVPIINFNVIKGSAN
jgi:hypothetical protein